MSREEDQIEILTCFGYCSFANEKKITKRRKGTTDETKKRKNIFCRQTDGQKTTARKLSLINE